MKNGLPLPKHVTLTRDASVEDADEYQITELQGWVTVKIADDFEARVGDWLTEEDAAILCDNVPVTIKIKP